MEVVARDLLLLQVMQDHELPVRIRANTWLEIYGNALVQDRTAGYIAAQGEALVRLVCDSKGPLASVVDTSLLKFREVDELQEIFQGWSTKAPYDCEWPWPWPWGRAEGWRTRLACRSSPLPRPRHPRVLVQQ